jgi:hypothetical protein
MRFAEPEVFVTSAIRTLGTGEGIQLPRKCLHMHHRMSALPSEARGSKIALNSSKVGLIICEKDTGSGVSCLILT